MLLLQDFIVYIWLLPVVMSVVTPLIMLTVWAINRQLRRISAKRSSEINVSERMVYAS